MRMTKKKGQNDVHTSVIEPPTDDKEATMKKIESVVRVASTELGYLFRME